MWFLGDKDHIAVLIADIICYMYNLVYSMSSIYEKICKCTYFPFLLHMQYCNRPLQQNYEYDLKGVSPIAFHRPFAAMRVINAAMDEISDEDNSSQCFYTASKIAISGISGKYGGVWNQFRPEIAQPCLSLFPAASITVD